MSQLITLTTKTDGSFDNYFEDTVKIPARAEIAYIKGLGLNVNYESYEFIKVPFIPPADEDKVVIRVSIDGVNITVKWEDIWDAYEEAQPTADKLEFFSGLWRWSLNPEDPGNVTATIAKAINDKFTFYDVRPNSTVTYNESTKGKPMISQFGITSCYSTNERLGGLLNAFLQNINNLSVYEGTATITGTDEFVATSNDVTVISTSQIAQNGGLVKFFNNTNDKTGKVGIQINSCPTAGSIPGHGTTLQIDYGVEFNKNGPGTFNIIKNNNTVETVNGYVGADGETCIFTIVVSRSVSPDTVSSEYTATLLQGWNPDEVDLEYDKYVVDKHSWIGGHMPTFVATDLEDGFELKEIQYIKAERQDLEASTFATQLEEPNNFGIGCGGTAYRNTHSFILSNVAAMSEDSRTQSREFFNALGFTTWTNDTDRNEFTTTLGNTLPNSTVISTKAPAKIRYQQIIYLPQNKPKILRYQDPADNETTLSETLPYLQFHIESLEAVTFEGNFQKGLKSRQQNTAVKVLQNIPKLEEITLRDTNVDDPETFTSYDYEVYNPLYVSLNNPSEIQLNQIKGRLVTPQNEIIKLDEFDNTPTAMIMLHIRKELATN